MTEKINWNLGAQVVGGTGISETGALDVEIFESGNVTIKKKEGNTRGTKEVNMSAGSTEKVQLVLIASSDYSDLTYKIADGDEKKLEKPLMLLGPGAAQLLGKDLNKITFSNGSDKEVSAKILIGRNA